MITCLFLYIPLKYLTHLDFNILAVDNLHNTHNIIKNKAQFLAVVCIESDMVQKKSLNKCDV